MSAMDEILSSRNLGSRFTIVSKAPCIVLPDPLRVCEDGDNDTHSPEMYISVNALATFERAKRQDDVRLTEHLSADRTIKFGVGCGGACGASHSIQAQTSVW